MCHILSLVLLGKHWPFLFVVWDMVCGYCPRTLSSRRRCDVDVCWRWLCEAQIGFAWRSLRCGCTWTATGFWLTAPTTRNWLTGHYTVPGMSTQPGWSSEPAGWVGSSGLRITSTAICLGWCLWTGESSQRLSSNACMTAQRAWASGDSLRWHPGRYVFPVLIC